MAIFVGYREDTTFVVLVQSVDGFKEIWGRCHGWSMRWLRRVTMAGISGHGHQPIGGDMLGNRFTLNTTQHT